MAVELTDQLAPVMAFGLVGVLGVGAQWLAWRWRMPAIVLMLVAGILIGPVTGVLDPERDIGPLIGPMISIAVAIILFEGGLTLDRRHLSDAAQGVRRLVFIGAPLGWLTSTLALHYAAGLGWESAAVFGGIMIVTGPTVIAPLLRQARLSKRPANLLQWEAILNDPVGALAAVLAFEVVMVRRANADAGSAAMEFIFGIGFAVIVGLVAGYGLARAFKRGMVPEYMKVPVLFTVLLAAFAIADHMLHESGLLAVTIMGVVIANAGLPSYVELHRFKEQATVLLVSGVFILLAANLDVAAMARLDWRAALFVAAIILVARPLTVFIALFRSGIPVKERTLVAFTGPRGVVLVAVAGLFGERLAALGVEDGALVGPLAFVLVATTVVLHGFTLAPFARFLGLTAGDKPGVIIVGGSPWAVALAQALGRADVGVLVTDPNHVKLRGARAEGVPTFTGDILSEAAEDRVEWVGYQTLIAATDNDAYNTLVTTDLAHEFGRESVFQVQRERAESLRHALPSTLGGRGFGPDRTFAALNEMIAEGWTFSLTRLTPEFSFTDWRSNRPGAVVVAWMTEKGALNFAASDADVRAAAGVRVLSMLPPESLTQQAV